MITVRFFAFFFCCAMIFCLACQAQKADMPLPADASRSTLLGGPCEGCEAVFEFGERELTPVDTLPDFGKDGPKLMVTGTIYQPDGKTPAEGVILYIHHTNQEGVYPPGEDPRGWEDRHGYLRGWIKTGTDGRYTFYTLKPASYPDSRNPAHIHPFVLEPNGYYYLDAYHFAGDPFLTDDIRNRDNAYGGNGVVRLRREGDMLVAERDLVLGLNVPGYPRR